MAHERSWFEQWSECAFLESDRAIPGLPGKPGIPSLRCAILGLRKFLLSAEHIYWPDEMGVVSLCRAINRDKRMATYLILLLMVCQVGLECLCSEIVSLSGSTTCGNFTINDDYQPQSPQVLCCLVYVPLY